MARILSNNKYESFVIEGPPHALYEDLWTIRSEIFKPSSHRFRFKKQFNGVWIEVLPPFSIDETPLHGIDIWDGETVEQELARGAIASKLILDKPSKIRFAKGDFITEVDISKLSSLAVANEYSILVDDQFISFTKISSPLENSSP